MTPYTEKVFLGTVKTTDNDHNLYAGDRIYLSKHSFDCGWYWGFGYIGNSNLHCHFNKSFLSNSKYCDELFRIPRYTNNQWWVIRDLYIQAYALKDCAEIYTHGGRQISGDDTKIIQSNDKAKIINDDLEKVLTKVWNLLVKWNKPHRE